MADTKALFTQQFDAARTAWTQGNEAAAAESLHSAIIAARSDPSLRRELAAALFNLGKLSRKFGRAGEADAGPLLTEALAISEELFGSADAALAPMLHELSRLHLQQSQHSRAEDALGRLLAIARVKGEEHPDVAAALSDLAFVKRKLGDEASAEALYRDALRIREKVLEPNHTATVGTLERLSETCAARGNFAEALALLHRALPAREAALGAGHERVRAARSRIAELESQMAIAAKRAAGASSTAPSNAAPIPAWLKRVPDSPVDTPSSQAPSPIDSKGLELLGASEPRVLRPAPIPRERAKTPTVAAAVAAASLMASSIQTASASQVVISPPESARPFGSMTGRESREAHRDVILADVVHTDIVRSDAARRDVALGDWRSSVALAPADSPAPARKRRTVLYAYTGVSAVAIALSALLMVRPRAASGTDPVPTSVNAAQRTAAAGALAATAPTTKTVSIGTSAAAMVAAPRADSLRAATATSAPTAAVIQREQRAPESAPAGLRAPRVEVRLDSVNLPSMPAAPSGEAILRSAMERQRESDTNRTEIRHDVSRSASVAVDNAHTSPTIIGRAPAPVFPEALLRSGTREGQVMVRFMVNERGRADVTTMIVEQSDHELFTAAVREILPSFRFEPAHTLGLASKPVGAWVSVPFRFTTNKR